MRPRRHYGEAFTDRDRWWIFKDNPGVRWTACRCSLLEIYRFGTHADAIAFVRSQTGGA